MGVTVRPVGKLRRSHSVGPTPAASVGDCAYAPFLAPLTASSAASPPAALAVPTSLAGALTLYGATGGAAGPEPVEVLTHIHHRFAMAVPAAARQPSVLLELSERAFLLGWKDPAVVALLDLGPVFAAPNSQLLQWVSLKSPGAAAAGADDGRAGGLVEGVGGPGPRLLCSLRYVAHMEAKLRVTIMYANLRKPPSAKQVGYLNIVFMPWCMAGWCECRGRCGGLVL